MNKLDYENLLNSKYTREELCWIILTCLDTIEEKNKQLNFYIDERRVINKKI